MAGKVSSDPNIFLLPDIGEGLQEAELKEWLVKVGDTVEENQNIAEVETDKALAEIPSPRNGVIAELCGEPGEMMAVGEPFVKFVRDGGDIPAAAPTPAPAAKAAPEPSEEREDAGTVVGSVSDDLPGMSSNGKALAAPAVRRLARDLGVDINACAGTGLGGRVTKKDVEAFANGGGGEAKRESAPSLTRGARSEDAVQRAVAAPVRREVASIPAGEDRQTVPFRGIRRKIAERLRESADKAVHFTVMDEADITDLNILRKKLSGASGEKLSPLPFVASAICKVLARDEFRPLNATTDDEKQEITRHRPIHLGLAVDTDDGLMVPVIRDCDALGVLEIGREVVRVANGARTRTLARDELMGSTFTLSNVGSHAGRFATPIINYPEAGILAAGRAREGMVVKNGMFRVGMLLPLSLACDHRVVDGALAAMALAEIVKLLQSPDQLLEPARR
ncbi:MAG: dihydrolipoamide acetyltransferase family protein [Planctomycetota bacterium]